MACRREHSLLYRNDALRVQLEIHTVFTKAGQAKANSERRLYYMDGDKRNFKTEEELLEALNEQKRQNSQRGT